MTFLQSLHIVFLFEFFKKVLEISLINFLQSLNTFLEGSAFKIHISIFVESQISITDRQHPQVLMELDNKKLLEN